MYSVNTTQQPIYHQNEMPQVHMYPPPGQVVITQQPPMQQPLVNNQNMSVCPFPVQAHCGTCNQTVTTTQTLKNGSGTWAWCLILGFFTGCCCIPFCVDSCKDKVHHCPRCQCALGMYEYKICK